MAIRMDCTDIRTAGRDQRGPQGSGSLLRGRKCPTRLVERRQRGHCHGGEGYILLEKMQWCFSNLIK